MLNYSYFIRIIRIRHGQDILIFQVLSSFSFKVNKYFFQRRLTWMNPCKIDPSGFRETSGVWDTKDIDTQKKGWGGERGSNLI